MDPTSHADPSRSAPASSDAWHEFLSRGPDRPPQPLTFDEERARRYLHHVSRLSRAAQDHSSNQTSAVAMEDFEGSLLLHIERTWRGYKETSHFEDWMMQTAKDLFATMQSRGETKSATAKTKTNDCPGAYIADFLARGLPPFPFLFDESRAQRYLKRTWGIALSAFDVSRSEHDDFHMEHDDFHMECIGHIEDKWPLYNPQKSALQTWVRTLARNLALDGVRRGQRQLTHLDSSQDVASTTPLRLSTDDSPATAYSAIVLQAYGRVVERMSTRQIDVLQLTMRHHSMADTEIGAALGLTAVQVKNARAEALNKLRGDLDFCNVELALAEDRATSAQRRLGSDPEAASSKAEHLAAQNWLHRSLRNVFLHLKDDDSDDAMSRASELGARLLPFHEAELTNAQHKLSDQQTIVSESTSEADREKAIRRISSISSTIQRLENELLLIRAAVQRWGCQDV